MNAAATSRCAKRSKRRWGGDYAASPAFYVACGDYMLFATDRSHAQGERIHARLKARIPASDTAAHEALDAQEETRRQGRELMRSFAAELDSLRHAENFGIVAFEHQAREFNQRFNSLMAPRKNPFYRYTDELFSEADWIEIADTSDKTCSIEDALFASVEQTAPDDINPAEMTVEH